MSKIYKEKLFELLSKLDVVHPDSVRMDQRQISKLLVDIKEGVDAYQPPPVGTALAADVRTGKTFSSALAGIDVAGTNSFDTDTSDGTAIAADILDGRVAYSQGAKLTGTCDYDADTSGGTATAADIKTGKVAYSQGTELIGTSLADRIRLFEVVEIGDPMSETASTAIAANTSGTHLVVSHDSKAFILHMMHALNNEAYFIGGSINTGSSVVTHVSMKVEITNDIAQVVSVKDADGTEVLTAWEDDSGTLVYFAEE